MMPKMDGFSLAKEIRSKDNKIPLIFITAKSLKEDKLAGYDLGADDYITKPFDEEELLWKIKAVIRRIPENKSESTQETVSIGKYTFDFVNQSISINGKTKRITEKESEILNYLSNNRNKVIKREEMLKELWGENDYFLGRSLDVFITKIRKYLKEDASLSIENVFGVGFIFNTPSHPPSTPAS
jgi:DNA-binding response OmpR family regulator